MRKALVVAVAALLLAMGCRRDMERLEVGGVNAQRQVLVAGTTSEFKESVVATVLETLGTRDYRFVVIGLGALDREQTDRYGAILLVCSYMAGRVDGRVTRFLARDPTNPRIIVFLTVGSEAAKPDFARPDIRVDAVSSASTPERAADRADSVAALIRKRFESDH